VKPARPRPCGLCVHAWRARGHPAGLRRRSAPRALLPLVIYLGVELLVLHALELFGDAVEARLHICPIVLLCLAAAAPHHGGTSLLGAHRATCAVTCGSAFASTGVSRLLLGRARTRGLAHARRAHFGVTSHRQHTTAGTCRQMKAPTNSFHELCANLRAENHERLRVNDCCGGGSIAMLLRTREFVREEREVSTLRFSTLRGAALREEPLFKLDSCPERRAGHAAHGTEGTEGVAAKVAQRPCSPARALCLLAARARHGARLAAHCSSSGASALRPLPHPVFPRARDGVGRERGERRARSLSAKRACSRRLWRARAGERGHVRKLF
jgi:hypothetical protein